MAISQKKYRSENPYDREVRERSESYKSMLQNLMKAIQEYLLLSDDNTECAALRSLALVNSTAEQIDENRICVWLEDFPY